MIDTDKYEGHSTEWKRKTNHSTYSIINDDGQKVASVPCYEECNKDSQLITDAPLLLEAYKRLRLVADELYLHIVGGWHMTLDELVAEMPWRNEE